MTAKAGRSLSRILLAFWAGMIASWLGVAALVALSILWPANQVPHVLLGLWACAVAAQQVWPGGRFRNRDLSLPIQILFAPLGPMLQVGHRIWRALGR
jgi:hypothetical protein